MEARRPDVTDPIRAHRPQAVLFDLAMAQPDFAVALLLKNPGLLLIGLDTESNRAVLVSGQKARSLTLNQIREIAEGRTR